MTSSRGSSWLRSRTLISYFSGIGRQGIYYQCHLGSPNDTETLECSIIMNLRRKEKVQKIIREYIYMIFVNFGVTNS